MVVGRWATVFSVMSLKVGFSKTFVDGCAMISMVVLTLQD
jgi:hypothetical protein